MNLLVLYDQGSGRKKFLVSDYLDKEGIVRAWDIRWKIETFHNDAKDLGMGEYRGRAAYTGGYLVSCLCSPLHNDAQIKKHLWKRSDNNRPVL